MVNQKEIDKFDVYFIRENSSHGYILNVYFEYPHKLHELHNDYPLAPEKREISHNKLSNYYGSIAYKNDIKTDDVNKLITNLGNKTKYVLHYRNLQLYLSLGMTLTKVKQFKQSDWLRTYTDFNTGKRKKY